MWPLKSKELADWLHLAPATIRLWANEGYGQFLSELGRGGDGKIRAFNETDARIFAFINALKQQGTDRDTIMQTLEQLRSEGWQDLPPMPPAPGGVITAVVSAETAQNALVTQRSALLREISLLEETIERLEGELHQERQQRQTAQAELTAAREQLGELRGKLEVIQVERRPASYWLAIVVIIAIAAILVTAGVTLLATGR